MNKFEFQKEILNAGIKVLDTKQTGYYIAPTGSGKTEIGIGFIKHYKKVLWVTYGRELVIEAYDRISNVLSDVGLVVDGVFDLNHDVVVASVSTLMHERHLYELERDKFDLIIFDEAHHIYANSWKKIFDYFNAKKLGQTATPIRGDGLDIQYIFENKIGELSYEDAIDKKIVATNKTYMIVHNLLNRKKFSIGNNNFKRHDIDAKVIHLERAEMVYERYMHYSKDLPYKKAICFCKTSASAIWYSKFFQLKGINAKYLLANFSRPIVLEGEKHLLGRGERNESYETFKNTREIEILFVLDILNEGKYIPDANIGIHLRDTSSPVVGIQQQGRLSRYMEEKPFFISIYFHNFNYRLSKYAYMPDKRTARNTIFDLTYFKSKDKFLLKKVNDYFHMPYKDFAIKYALNKEEIIYYIKEFYSEHGKIRSIDFKKENNLPPYRNVIKTFGTIQNLIKEAGIEINDNYYNKPREWTRDSIAKALKEYNRDKPLSTADLGLSNNLPPLPTIKKYFGSWKKCVKTLGIKNRANNWTKELVIKTIEEWISKNNRKPYRADFYNNNKGDLPPHSAIKKFFISYEHFKSTYPHLVRERTIKGTYVETGISKRNNNYRVQVTKNGKTTSVGTFKTLEEARNKRMEALNANKN